MAFIQKGLLNPNAGSLVIGGAGMAEYGMLSTVITNSGVVKVGDVLSITTAAAGNGVVVRRYNAGGNAVLGICTSVSNLNGSQATPDSGTTDTWTVGSDNETAAKKYAIVSVSRNTIWSAPLSATIHTTAAFGFGRYCDPDTGANSGRIAEASVTATLAQGRGLTCLGPDPDDSTRGMVAIGVESVFDGAS